MTSTSHRDSEGRPHGTPRRRASDRAHSGHGRHRTASRVPTKGRIRGTRPTAFWPFADAEQLPGTALLAGWLGRAIITLVTTYTRPGDRVLLLTPPASARVPWCTSGRVQDSDQYGGLAEAVWTVSRLGRGADTATGVAVPDYRSGRTDSLPHARAESVTRPRPSRFGLRPVAEPDPDSAHRPRKDGDRSRGKFYLIITAVNPGATDWLGHTDWDALLTPDGLTAVITHSESRAGRLIDPYPVLADTFGNHRLRCLDHIAVQSAPMPGPVAAERSTSMKARRDSPPHAGTAVPAAIRAAHHDLVLFGRPPAVESEADAVTGEGDL